MDIHFHVTALSGKSALVDVAGTPSELCYMLMQGMKGDTQIATIVMAAATFYAAEKGITLVGAQTPKP